MLPLKHANMPFSTSRHLRS